MNYTVINGPGGDKVVPILPLVTRVDLRKKRSRFARPKEVRFHNPRRVEIPMWVIRHVDRQA
jgi:hypothetical protein